MANKPQSMRDLRVYAFLRVFQLMLGNAYYWVAAELEDVPEMMDGDRIFATFEGLIEDLNDDFNSHVEEENGLEVVLSKVQERLEVFVDTELAGWDHLLDDKESEIVRTLYRAIDCTEGDPWLSYAMLGISILLTMNAFTRHLIKADVYEEYGKFNEAEIEGERQRLLANYTGLVPFLEKRITLLHVLLSHVDVLYSCREDVNRIFLAIAPQVHKIIRSFTDALLRNIEYCREEGIQGGIRPSSMAVAALVGRAMEQRNFHIVDDEELREKADEQIKRVEDMDNTLRSIDIYVGEDDYLYHCIIGHSREVLFREGLGYIESFFTCMNHYYGERKVMYGVPQESAENLDSSTSNGVDRFNHMRELDYTNELDESDGLEASNQLDDLAYSSHLDKSDEANKAQKNHYMDDEDNIDTINTTDHVEGSSSDDTPDSSDPAYKKMMAQFSSRNFPARIMDYLYFMVRRYDGLVDSDNSSKSSNIHSNLRKIIGQEESPADAVIRWISESQDNLLDKHFVMTDDSMMDMIFGLKELMHPLFIGIRRALEDEPSKKDSLIHYSSILTGGMEALYFAYRFGQISDQYRDVHLTEDLVEVKEPLFIPVYTDEIQGNVYCDFMRTGIQVDSQYLEEGINKYLVSVGKEAYDISSELIDLCNRLADYWDDQTEGICHDDTDLLLDEVLKSREKLDYVVHYEIDLDEADEKTKSLVRTTLYRLKIYITLYEEGMRQFFINMAREYDE